MAMFLHAATVLFVPTNVNLKVLLPSTGYLGHLHIMESLVASSMHQETEALFAS